LRILEQIGSAVGGRGGRQLGRWCRHQRRSVAAGESYSQADFTGVVFKVNIQAKTETVVYTFNAPTDGEIPTAGFVRDRKGNLYGTTAAATVVPMELCSR